MNNIIGYVKEIIGNFTATNNVDGSFRLLKLNDPIHEGEFVISEDVDGKIIIGFNDNQQEIILAGNDGLLFDAALLAAKFKITEPNNDVQDEDEIDEDEIDEPGAGEEDLIDENGDTGGISSRTAGETNVNSELSTAAFIRQEPDILPRSDEKVESHGSFSIIDPTAPTASDNAVFTPKEPVITPVSPPVTTPPPVITPPSATPPPVTTPPLVTTPPVTELPVFVNDVPEAIEDFNEITEDSQPNTIDGNVFSNDDIGNDIPDFPVTSVNGVAVGTEIAGEYGAIVINKDGSYSYQLLNEHLAVQALTTGESLTEVFSYTITDSDGDSDTTTLTITITGTNDGVTLTIPDNVGAAGGSDEQVFEHGLATGSNPNNDDVVHSSFTLKALDGLDHISINGSVINAQTLVASASSPITVTTSIGTLVLNGYAMAADGTITVDYTYTLATNQDHSISTISDDFSIIVTDTDGDSSTDVLNIRIINDIPTAVSDSNTLNGDSISVTANVFTNDTIGADQTSTPVTGVVAGQSSNAVQGQVNTRVTGSYGEVVVQANGSYTYLLNSDSLAVLDLTDGESLTDIFTYTITDSDGDSATTTLTITIGGENDGVSLTIPDNVGPLGGGEEQVFEHGLATGSTPNNDDVVNSSFTLKALDGLDNISLNGNVISAQSLVVSASSPITVTTSIGTLVLNDYSMAADGTITVDYTYTLTANQNHSTSTVNDDISIVVTDTDGDSTTEVLTINIVDDAPIANNDITRNVTEGGITITGNVIDNTTNDSGDDVLSADRENEISSFTYTNEVGNVVTGAVGTSVDTQYGSLTLNADGSWVFISDITEDHSTTDPLSDQFTYTLTDNDGSFDTAVQVITVSDGVNTTINNPIVIVYEGSSAITFNGVAPYDKSISNAAQDGTSTLTHKLDFTADSDNADIVSFTFDGITKTIDPSDPSNSATITGTGDKGELTVYFDGTWTYTPPITYGHDTANGVNNFQTTFTYIVQDTDGDIITGSQTIQVDDTLPELTSATDNSIDEKYLAVGTNPNPSEVTKTGTITAIQESGAVDITFSATQTSLDNLITAGLSSSNDAISFVISNEGHTLTASANGSPALTVTINDATDVNNVGYTVTLLKPLDHESPVLTNNDIVMALAIDIIDDDGDTDSATFNITIIDDAPLAAQVMAVDEDSDLSDSANTINILTHADATLLNTIITANDTAPTYGTVTLNADGTITYTPYSNFSGEDKLTYSTILDNGTLFTTTVTITVTPITDAPKNLVGDTELQTVLNLQTEEDTAVALGLNAPTQTDKTDASGASDNMDNPELYGVITLSGIPNGATLVKSDGSTLVYNATGADITIVLSNGDHMAGTTAMLTMTIADYESMQIIPPLDTHNNISFTVNVSSYEVDNLGVDLGIAPAPANATVNIDVQAVTDPVSLTYTGAASITIDEDTSLNLTASLNEIFGDKLDGSETFTYELTGLPEGTILSIKSSNNDIKTDIATTFDASGITYQASATFIGVGPTITLTPPKDFSGDITNITITLTAVDSDGDSTDVNPLIVTESDSVTLALHVNPIANDVAISSVSVAEDTPVAFLANLRITDENNDGVVADHDEDGNDRITEITIGNLGNGFELTTANGTNFYTSTSDGSEFIITIGTTTVASTGPNTGTFTIADATSILLDSHRPHSSADIPLDITVKAMDSQHVNGSDVDSVETTTLFTAANPDGSNPLMIEVTAVAETKTSDTDGANGNDVVSQGDYTYVTHVVEDSSWIDLNTFDDSVFDFNLAVSNEDDENAGLTSASNSETTMINFSNVPVGSQFKFTLNTVDNVFTVTNSTAGVDIPLAGLGSLQFMPVAQFSGTITIHMAVKTTDHDEDNNNASSTETSAYDTLILEVDPVADNVTLAIKQALGDEDAGRNTGNSSNIASASTINNAANGIALDITTTTDDKDGSETFVVTISDIPDAGEIYYNGTLMNIGSGGQTNINNGVSSPLIATDANGTDGTWTIQIDNFDNNVPLTFIPPHNDESNYTFTVSAYAVDGTVSNQASPQTLTIDVDVKGVADIPKNTALNGFDINVNDLNVTSNNATGAFNYVTTEAVLDAGTNQLDFQKVYQTPNTLNSYDDDGSEALTIAITGLASQFSIENATFMGGAGTARQWLFNVNDIANIKVNSPINFSGEIDLTVKYITTESEGDSATHPTEDIKILVTPNAEASINTGTTINEDQLSLLDFSIIYQNGDTDETIETIRINKDDVTAADFTLYFGNSTAETLAQAVSTNADITDDGTYYVLTNNAFNNIYALGSADVHGSYSFAMIYDIKDSVNTSVGSLEDITPSVSTNYNLTVNAITDDINVSLGTIVGGSNGTVSGSIITVTDNTTITVEVNVLANDDIAEGGGAGNGADTDSSEQVTRFVIENVSAGITVEGGIYAGDIYNTTTSQYEDSGIWYVNVNEVLDSDGISKTVTFNVDGNTTNFNTSVIKITAYNEDNNNEVLQNDFTTFTIVKDGTYSGINQVGTPAIIATFAVKAIIIKEDTAFTLDNAISATTTGASAFSIVLTDVLAGSTVTGALQQGNTWIVHGNGDSTAVLAAMQAVTITPPANYNSFGSADADTFVFNATMTTYAAFTQNTNQLSFDKPVYPLTDDLTIGVTQDGTTTEDNSQTFTISLSNDADGDNTKIIGEKLYLRVTENYTDSGAAIGVLTDGNGNILATEVNPTGLPSASYYVVSSVNYTDTLTFSYNPGEHRQGSVDIDVYTKNQETHAWGGVHPDGDTAINLSHQQFSFDITPVIDGSAIVVNNVLGTEDAIIAGIADSDNWVKLDLIQSHIDPSESLVTALLDNIPDGFLIHYQDPANASNYLLAHNAGESTVFGSQFNQWSIPLNNGGLPNKVYIQAPENWSGTVASIKFTTFTAEQALTSLAETSALFNLDITAVADGLTLNVTKTFGNEGDDIALNLNANVIDLDGSETVTITLAGLGVDANFKANSQDISDSNISYDNGSGIYTISNIAVIDINNLSFVQQHFTGPIIVKANTVESSNSDSSTIVSGTFSAIISEVTGTSSDDTLFYKQGNNVDALGGIDTLILSNDVGIDFSSLTNADGIENIELIDLQQNGNHDLVKLSLQDVIDMTDGNNELIIQGDSNDSISFTNGSNSNGWVKGGPTFNGGHNFDIYTNIHDASVTVKVEQDIIDIIL